MQSLKCSGKIYYSLRQYMTSVVITQPMLFPWIGFFEQLAKADIYVYLKDVQFSVGSFTNRVQIKLHSERKWMTIPLCYGGKYRLISDLIAAGDRWKASHRALVIQSLRSYRYRDDAISIFDHVYSKTDLKGLLVDSVEAPARYMQIGLNRAVTTASELDVGGTSWERVLGIVKRVGGDRYITGHGAARYLDHSAFEAASVTVEYMKYGTSTWQQQGQTFTRHVSILDLIASVGPRAAEYLRPDTVTWREFLAGKSNPTIACVPVAA